MYCSYVMQFKPAEHTSIFLQIKPSYPEESGVVAFRLPGLRIILSRVLTI